jgi:hypothetical protein
MKVLAERLFKSARLFLQSALAAYDSQEAHVFLLHGGTALEHMLKARLAELNPALLAKKDSVPSLAWFADETKHTGPTSIEMRTITMEEALALASAIGAQISIYKDSLTILQRHRNGVAHLGLADEKVAYEVLPAFLAVMIQLTTELSEDPSELFGPYHSFALSQLEEYRAEQERVYEGRIAQALMRFKDEHGELDSTTKAKLAELVELKWHRTDILEQLMDCPACTLPGYAEGDLEITDWEADFDKEGNAEGGYPVLSYQPRFFRCPTCCLVLDTPELIRLGDLLSRWDLPEEDYDAFVREYYDEQAAQYYEDYR